MNNFGRIFFATIFAVFFYAQNQAFGAEEFFLRPSLTLEYSAPEVSSGGVNVNFKTPSLGDQLEGIENITFGAHLRIHENLGFNANWTQTDLENNVGLQNYFVYLNPHFKMDYYNFSALFFAPIEKDSFELFAEAGLSDMVSSLVIFESVGRYSKLKDHQTNPFLGLGFQLAPFEKSQDAFRFSVQRYIDKINIIDVNFTSVRIGYIKRF